MSLNLFLYELIAILGYILYEKFKSMLMGLILLLHECLSIVIISQTLPHTVYLIQNSFAHLLPAVSTGQERRNKPESSAAKALLLTSSGAREQEQEQESKKKNKNKKAREREQESKRKNKNKKARARERKSKNKREKKNGKTPSLLRRIILRLGRITP